MAEDRALAVRSETVVLPNLRQQLTNQFYAWEKRGRGWIQWDSYVEIEPPFCPFYRFLPKSPAYDDARKPTLLSFLVDSVKSLFTGTANPSQDEPFLEESLIDIEPVYSLERGEPMEVQITLPENRRIDRDTALQFFLNLSYCSGPVSFEVIGWAERIVIQLACFEADYEILLEQLKAFYPDLIFHPDPGFLKRFWYEKSEGRSLVVDFGLSEEFTRPLRTYSAFDPDPLIGIVAGLSNLQEGEVGIYQVLFQPVASPWAESILYSLTDWEGNSFFLDAPEMLKMARQKISRPLVAVVVRAGALSRKEERLWQIVKSLGGSLTQFTEPGSNELIPLSNDGYYGADHELELIERLTCRSGMILNLDELVSLAHLPSLSVHSEKMRRGKRKSKKSPHLTASGEVLLGHNEHDGETVPVYLGMEERLRHTHVIGASGTGKSTLLLNLIVQDIENGRGVGVLDPHGDLIDQVLMRIPENRFEDVVLFDPSDQDYPIGFNILSAENDTEKNLISSDLVSVFRRLATSWGDQMTTVLGNAVIAILESETGGTLSDLRRFLVESDFRNQFLSSVQDQEIVYYWKKEYPLLSGRPHGSILTRLDAFLRPKTLRYIVSQKDNRLDFSRIMNEGKIFLAKLAQGAIGEENAFLLGSLLVSKLHQAAIGRQAIPEAKRRPYLLTIDEFSNFITPSMAAILSGARKYRLGLTLAHQELRQIESRDSDVAHSVLSNPYTRICFRLGESDARKIADGFSFFEARDFQNLGTGEAIVRVERADYDFNLSISPLPPVEERIAEEKRNRIIALTREKYATCREEVEKTLALHLELDLSQPSIAIPKKRRTEEIVQAETVIEPKIEFQEVVPYPVEKRNKTTPAPKSDIPPLMGRGGQQHQYLQQLIKRWAEGLGYRATIEKPILDGSGSVDVALEKEERSIACEISITTSIDQEIKNVRKCLEARFTQVVLIVPIPDRLKEFRNRIRESFSSEEMERIRCLTPDDLLLFIEELEAEASKKEETVRGYKVKVQYRAIKEEEKQVKKQAISKVIVQAMKRMKDK